VSYGCGGVGPTPSHQVVLQFWKPFVDSDGTQQMISDYEQKHPNVRIEYTKKNIETYKGDLLNAMAAGEGPDVFSIQNNWLPEFIDKTTPAPDKTFTFNDFKNTFVDTIVQDFSKNNKIYGVALSVDSLGLYYNKDLLGTAGIARPPQTWAQLATDVRQLTRQDSTGYFTRSGVAAGLNSNVNRAVDILYLMMLQKGVIPWTADGLNPTFSQSVATDSSGSNPGSEALNFYTSFADPSSLNYTWNSRSDYSIDSFANGRAAFLYSYSYTRATIDQKSPHLNYDVAPVPQPSLDQPAVNFSNYFGEVVNKQSKNSAVAWDFLKFISSKDEADKFDTAQKVPAARKDLIEQQIQDPDLGVFAHANLTAKSFYTPSQEKLDAIFSNMIDNVVLRGIAPDQALSQAESEAATLTQQH
jgi:ABC-type glycerol-3-phosphate transport system substrate-binding protein